MKTCPICYDEFCFVDSVSDEDNAAQQFLITILPCQHACCRDCLYQHCHYWITLHKVPVMCPLHIDHSCAPSVPPALAVYTKTCSTALTNKIVHDIVCSCHTPQQQQQQQEENAVIVCESINSNQLWNKYLLLLQKKLRRTDPALVRKCSNCLSSFSLLDDKDNDTFCAATLCAICRHASVLNNPFKAQHDDADDQAELLALQQILKSMPIKPCSHCSMPISKSGGCDHVVCPACHQDMCYKCGTHLHLQGESYIISCSLCRQDYVDHRQLHGRFRWMCCCCVYLLPLYLPVIFIYVLCTTLIGVISLSLGLVTWLIMLPSNVIWNLNKVSSSTTVTDASSYLGVSPKSAASFATTNKTLPLWKRITFGLRVAIFVPGITLLNNCCCCFGAVKKSLAGCFLPWSWCVSFCCSIREEVIDDDSDLIDQDASLSLLARRHWRFVTSDRPEYIDSDNGKNSISNYHNV